MSGRVQGKVALVTGAARGQGRSHALKLASEGADIVAVDACESFDTISYPMATEEDLAETARLIEKLDRRVVTLKRDVRDFGQMQEAARTAVSELGHLDIVAANAGICAMAPEQPFQAWVDVVNVNLIGVYNTVNAAVPHLKEGGSIVVTGSVAALIPGGPSPKAGGQAYSHAKRTLISLVQSLAGVLAPQMIRINGVHPTNCNTDMLQHEDMYRTFRPDLEHPTKEDALLAFPKLHAMPVPWVEPEDISNTVLYFASDESKYVTGQFLAVDAGALLNLASGAAQW